MSTAPYTESAVQRPQRFASVARWLCVALCALGWYLSIQLLQVSGGAAATGAVQALCGDAGPDGESDCLSVLRSRRAFLRSSTTVASDEATGIPWAAVGAAYFAMLACWHVFVGRANRARFYWQLIIAALTAFGVLLSVELVQVMAYELKRWCNGCVAVHLVNGALFLLTVASLPWRRSPQEPPPYPTLAHGGAALTAGLALALLHPVVASLAMSNATAARFRQEYTEITSDAAFVRWHYERQPIVVIPARTADYTLGDSDAPHQVVMFVDLRCVACRAAHALVGELVRTHPQSLSVDTRHAPLDRRCNPHARSTSHPGACAAALAVEAAGAIGGAEAFHAMLDRGFEQQDQIEGDPFESWAADLGLDPGAFQAARASPSVLEQVRSDVELAGRLGVRAMPAVFVDGRRFEHWRNRAAWTELLGLSGGATSTTAGTSP